MGFATMKRAPTWGSRVNTMSTRAQQILPPLLLFAFLIRLPSLIWSNEWYQDYDLEYGGTYGEPPIPDTNSDKTEAIILQIRLTVCVYFGFAIASIAGGILQLYVGCQKGKEEEEGEAGSSSPTFLSWLTRRRGLQRYIIALALTTAAVRVVVHGIVASQLLPKKQSLDVYFWDTLHEMKAGYGREPPLADYAAYAAEPRCSTVLEGSLANCENSSRKQQPVCTSPPCASDTVVDTNAIGRSLDTFRSVHPMPDFTTAIPYDDIWRDFYDMPFVIRNTTGQQGSIDMKNVQDVMSLDDVQATCAGDGHRESVHKYNVGYDMENPKFYFGTNFAGLYSKVGFSLQDFFEYNIRCNRETWKNATEEDKKHWEEVEDQLADFEIFLVASDALPRQNDFQFSGADVNEVHVDGIDRPVTLEQFTSNALVNGTSLTYMDAVMRHVDSLRLKLLHSPKYCGRGYLFDDGVFETCPEILNKVPFVQYSSDDAMMLDMGKQLGFEEQKDRQWPTWFIGNAGAKAKIHQDGLGLAFFLYIAAGRKLFRVIRAEDSLVFSATHDRKPKLGDRTNQNSQYFPQGAWMNEIHFKELDDTDEPDPFDVFKDSKQWDRMAESMTMYETVLEAGDIIYIPRWGHHSAMNLVDGTISVSGNYMHQSMWPLYRDLCRSRYVKAAERLKRFCGWAGVVEYEDDEGSYGHALYMGFSIMALRARIHLLSPIVRTLRKLANFFTRRVPAWPLKKGGWTAFYGFGKGAPKECLCCCEFKIGHSDESKLSKFVWTQPLEVHPLTECSMSPQMFKDLDLNEENIQPRMEACFHRTLRQRYRLLFFLGALPALLVCARVLALALWNLIRADAALEVFHKKK